jgi:hypothetical protein
LGVALFVIWVAYEFMLHFIHFFFGQPGDLFEESEIPAIVTELTPTYLKTIYLQTSQIEDPLGSIVVIGLG